MTKFQLMSKAMLISISYLAHNIFNGYTSQTSLSDTISSCIKRTWTACRFFEKDFYSLSTRPPHAWVRRPKYGYCRSLHGSSQMGNTLIVPYKEIASFYYSCQKRQRKLVCEDKFILYFYS